MKGKLGGGVDENVEGEPDKNGMSNIVLFLPPLPTSYLGPLLRPPLMV